MKITLLSMTTIEDDPRVRRQGDALHGDGHEVVAVGTPGPRSGPPAWEVRHVPARARTRAADLTLAARLALPAAIPSTSEKVYWSLGFNRRYLNAALATGASEFVANDWWVLPVAAEAARRSDGRYHYDSHEFAVEENAHRLAWRLLFPRYIDRLERRYIGGAATVWTVADTIADLMAQRYGLAVRPLVVRNVPPRTEVADHVPEEPFTVLYQGVLNADRGLEVLIESVAGWDPAFRLVVRGTGSDAYRAHLSELAAAQHGRVVIDEPVPMTEMVRAAATADVGIFAIPGSNRQARYCLPNKLFEYTMAGLALCVSDVAEMRRVVEQYDLGVLITETTPEGIATAVNRLTSEVLAHHRRQARDAAHELCWEVEQHKMTDAFPRAGR